MGNPFPCPDHSFAWLYEGFSSCLRTSHPNSHGKPNWKPQKAITLKALCSESSTCLPAPAPLTGLCLWDTGTQKGFTRGTTQQLSLEGKEGLAVLTNAPPSSSPLPPSHWECKHAAGSESAEPGKRMFVSVSSSLRI